MLTTRNQQLNSIFERIIRDKNGVLVRVRFTVVQIDGTFQPQIISATPIVATQTQAEKPICLPCINKQQVIAEDYTPTFVSKISPYFSLDFILTSQPTRAPSNR